MSAPLRDKIAGYLCGIAAAVAYGLNALFALPLYDRGFSPSGVLFYRYGIAAVLLAAVLAAGGGAFKVKLRNLPPLIAGGILLALSSESLFLAFRHMDVGIASTLLFVYPLMVAGIMAGFFHERLSRITAAGILLAITGVALLNGCGGCFSWTGTLLVLVSALTYAVYMVLVKVSSVKTLPAATLTWYAMVFALPVFLLPLRGGLDLKLPGDLVGWGCVLGLALFPALLSFLLMALAIRRVGATATALLGALEPATALVCGVLVFGEVLTFRAFCGIALIIGAVAGVIGGEALRRK